MKGRPSSSVYSTGTLGRGSPTPNCKLRPRWWGWPKPGQWAKSRLASPSDVRSQFQDAEAIGLGDPAWPLPKQGAPTPTYHACSRAALTPNRDDSTLLVGRKVTRYLPNASENQLTAGSLLHSTRAAPGTGWKPISKPWKWTNPR